MPSEHKIRRDDDDGNTYQGEENLDSLGLPDETGAALKESQEKDSEMDSQKDFGKPGDKPSKRQAAEKEVNR